MATRSVLQQSHYQADSPTMITATLNNSKNTANKHKNCDRVRQTMTSFCGKPHQSTVEGKNDILKKVTKEDH
eukprot:23171-Amphidinium_carterae.1